MKHILITGDSGLLGSTLEKILIPEKGYITHNIGFNLPDKNKVESYAIIEPIDWIIHTAAITNVDYCEKNKKICKGVNVEGTQQMRDLAKKLDSKFLYIS